MKRKSRRKRTTRSNIERPRRPRFVAGLILLAACAGVVVGGVIWWQGRKVSAPEVYSPRPPGRLTFSRDIAPIIYQQCANCHRPGQSAPFPLLTYQDVKKHAVDIADVTARRYMPPWLPEKGHGDFVGERRLSLDQIGLIQQWVAEGAAEGVASDLPPAPRWTGEWQLGEPDLVVTMPQPYLLSAEGRDVYRNFVIPVPMTSRRFVRGVEFRPGNPQVVHHTFVKVDRTWQSRRLDAQDAEAGFAGMNVPAEMPDGHFLGWQPGRVPAFVPEDLAWRLDPGNDIVVQMHMNPTGKPEPVQPSVGLYFTERPPTNTCFKMALTSFVLDIPAGATNYVVQDSYTLPVDVQVIAVLPHAHYLAKDMQGWATRPDGTRQSLLWIKQWDFNWQGDYRYAKPVFLPKGSKLSMRFTYDNSTNNVANPNHPPKPVTYGPQSSDEMAELWFQLLPANQRELNLLASDLEAKTSRTFVEFNEYAIRKNPDDAAAHNELGLLLAVQDKLPEAESHLRAAIQARPEFALAHYNLGLVYRRQGKIAEARTEFETALRLDPNDSKSHGNLGFICLERGELQAARLHFESALRLNPDDAMARSALNDTLKALGQPGSRR